MTKQDILITIGFCFIITEVILLILIREYEYKDSSKFVKYTDLFHITAIFYGVSLMFVGSMK